MVAAGGRKFTHVGVWLNREDFLQRKPGHLQRIFDRLAAIGATHVYPELYFRGGAAYASGVAPEHGEFRSRRVLLGDGAYFQAAATHDLVDELLRLARERNLQLHPWVWVFCAGYWHAYGPILDRHPEWAELDQDGQPFSNWRYGTAWLCPVLPAVREYLAAVLVELATRWPVDGIGRARPGERGGTGGLDRLTGGQRYGLRNRGGSPPASSAARDPTVGGGGARPRAFVP